MCEATGASTECSLLFPAILDVEWCRPVREADALYEEA
jgi:hypothetical protein